MECNRDEALRAKEISERKFSAKDITGAKKFALKARSLYPELDGIPQMLATLDIYIAAENKINGESDFYGILGVNPLADDDTVRKTYRKLALFLHPDKNKSIGADGAFKYISEAWSLLSDKDKRSAYDQRRNPNGVFQNNGAPPPGQNGFYDFTRSTATRTNKQTNAKTFWTVCHGCKMQYEYLRMYLHQNLLCPNCHEPFLAMETPAPNTKVSTKGFKSSKGANKNAARNRTGSQKTEAGCSDSSFQWVPFSKTGSPTSSAQAVSMVQRAYERVKREREEAKEAIKREETLRRKKNSKKPGTHTPSHVGSVKNAAHGNVGLFDEGKSVSGMNTRTPLIEKAKTEIKKKLHEWSSITGSKSEARTLEKTHLTGSKSESKTHLKDDEKNMDNSVTESRMIDVLDPDFHNFDRDRCDTCFEAGQLWAAYDDDDGMPRRYALIHKVNSFDPFKITVRWLNSRTNTELDRFSGFSKAFGEFKTGKRETVSVPNYFSHKVTFTELSNETIQVYPKKGDVWALYRFWSPDWTEETPNSVKHKYEIVEIDAFDEQAGFTVTPLIKVSGFKTVFHRHLNPKEARMIPEGEIFRFSHRIPSYLLTGQESWNAPKGCRELDPAATPDEFLQVIADGREAGDIDYEEDDDAFEKDSVLVNKSQDSIDLAEANEE